MKFKWLVQLISVRKTNRQTDRYSHHNSLLRSPPGWSNYRYIVTSYNEQFTRFLIGCCYTPAQPLWSYSNVAIRDASVFPSRCLSRSLADGMCSLPLQTHSLGGSTVCPPPTAIGADTSLCRAITCWVEYSIIRIRWWPSPNSSGSPPLFYLWLAGASHSRYSLSSHEV